MWPVRLPHLTPLDRSLIVRHVQLSTNTRIEDDVRESNHNKVFSISPAEIRREVNFFCVTFVCIPKKIIASNFFKYGEQKLNTN